jgi:cytochrome c oxidase subunit IV
LRTGGLVFAGTAAFFLVIAGVYWFTSYEDAGTAMLVACGGLGIIAGGYLLWQARGQPQGPEDRDDASPVDGAGELGAFPARSVWPLALAGGAVLAAVGLVFGVWFAVPGSVLMVISATAAVVESRRGGGAIP